MNREIGSVGPHDARDAGIFDYAVQRQPCAVADDHVCEILKQGLFIELKIARGQQRDVHAVRRDGSIGCKYEDRVDGAIMGQISHYGTKVGKSTNPDQVNFVCCGIDLLA